MRSEKTLIRLRDAQVDLSLRWSQKYSCGLCRALAQIIITKHSQSILHVRHTSFIKSLGFICSYVKYILSGSYNYLFNSPHLEQVLLVTFCGIISMKCFERLTSENTGRTPCSIKMKVEMEIKKPRIVTLTC